MPDGTCATLSVMSRLLTEPKDHVLTCTLDLHSTAEPADTLSSSVILDCR